jgi:hypothetical protein
MAQVLVDVPASGITNYMIAASPPIDANKLYRHQSIDRELFGPAVTVAALTTDVHIVRGTAGTLVGFQAAICGTIATGADRTITVDLQKSTGAGAYSTVLSGTIGFTNASVLRTAVSGTFSNTSLVAGDILRVIVTVAGSASAQALGLVATLTYAEQYS